MKRDLVNFMSSKVINKNTDQSRLVNTKDATIYNIRKNENGLYFDLKTTGDYEVSFHDLFIPSKFYQTQNINLNKNLIIINKKSILEYFLLYPAAIISVVFIIKTLASNWNAIMKIFGL